MSKSDYRAWVAAEVRNHYANKTPVRQMRDVVRDVLTSNGGTMKREEIIDQISNKELINKDDDLKGAIQGALIELVDDGEIQHPKRGYYRI